MNMSFRRSFTTEKSIKIYWISHPLGSKWHSCLLLGRLAEWSKAHVWSTCFRVFGTRVRIPDLPDFLKISRPSGALFKKRDNWFGRLAEWLKAHVSNTCSRLSGTRVRIPNLPFFLRKLIFIVYYFSNSSK